MSNNMTFQLFSGRLMPMIGFGTDKVIGCELTKKVLDYALTAGYRLFDTATLYGNEKDIGFALKELLPRHNLNRGDIFLTTKLHPSEHGDKAYQAIEKSIRNLNCEYIDLYLIHWPGADGVCASSEENSKLRDKSWQELIRATKNGLVKDIGVANYNIRHLKELLANDHGMKPVINQVEFHPHHYPKDILDFCQKECIFVQAYMSLGGSGNKELVNNEEIKKIAERLGKSPAQILLRWAVQQGVAVIPKSTSKEHIESNFDLCFDIPDEDMKTLSSFKTRKKYDWDSDSIV